MNNLQEQYYVLQQSTREIYIKINLLNENDVIVDSLEGIAVDGSLEITNSSSNRRTGNIKMVLTNKFIVKYNSLLWINKRVQKLIGIKNFINNNIIWFDQGKYAVSDCNFIKNNTEQVANFTLLDYMSLLDGTLAGHISSKISIPNEGVTIRQALLSLFKELGNISKLAVDDIIIDGITSTLPYTIEKEINSTVYDVAKELIELYMGQEMFFNEAGYLVVQKIKNLKNDIVTWDFTQDNRKLLLSCDAKYNYANLYNSITVWGNTNDVTGEQVTWTYRNKYKRNTFADMNNITDKAVGDICYVTIENKSYVWNNNLWNLLSFNVVPEFNIETIGEKINSYSEDKIYTIDQAKLKAEYELWKHSNFNENISISCVPIYLLNVNKKIKVCIPEINVDGEYQINNITVPLKYDGIMQIEASKIYY